ncbi:LOW QUALITY PROTEIN: protein spinster homolog 1 [Eudromia elegans]
MGQAPWVSVGPPGSPMAPAGPQLRRADDVGGGDAAVGQEEEPPPPPPARPPGLAPRRAGLTVAVLCYVNLLNYMDRFTVAGVLPDIEEYFGIGDGSSGLLQTAFIFSYLLLAPIFGYLGDRRSRKGLLCGALALWSGVTLASSFVPPQRFWALLVARALVGGGEAAFSTVAPTLVADAVAGRGRGRALGCFYLATPLGSGLGYIAGAKVKEVAADWHWALRVTPLLGLVALLLLGLVVQDPPRGGPDRTFVLSTLGFTAVAFVTGALALWAPAFLYRSRLARGDREPCGTRRDCHSDESVVFGALTCVAGAGVAGGAELSRRLRPLTPRGDPLLCGGALLAAAPFVFLALVVAPAAPALSYGVPTSPPSPSSPPQVFIFIGETLLSFNWAIVADILMDVVVPTRRSTAEALQILVSHLLGDAGSPYVVGLVSDALRGPPPGMLGGAARALLP